MMAGVYLPEFIIWGFVNVMGLCVCSGAVTHAEN